MEHADVRFNIMFKRQYDFATQLCDLELESNISQTIPYSHVFIKGPLLRQKLVDCNLNRT